MSEPVHVSRNISLDVAAIKGPIVDELPLACSNERAAVEFFEAKRWPDGCACISWGSLDVYEGRKSEKRRDSRLTPIPRLSATKKE